MASRMRLLPRSMKLEKSSRTSDLLWRMHDEKDVLTSALDMPEIMSYIYSKSWKLQFSASSSIIIIEDYYLQTFLHSLSGFPSCWSPSVYSR